jgi:hypothetical protein
VTEAALTRRRGPPLKGAGWVLDEQTLGRGGSVQFGVGGDEDVLPCLPDAVLLDCPREERGMGWATAYIATLQVGDIVLCKVNGSQYLHLIKAIQGARVRIGNNRGRINGWITGNSIYGKCTKVE